MNLVGCRRFFALALLVAPTMIVWNAVAVSVSRSAFGEDDKEKQRELAAAVQNPLLREHFRQFYPGVNDRRHPPNQAFINRFIDWQIENFLKDIDTRLQDLHDQSAAIRLLRDRIERMEESGEPFPNDGREAMRSMLLELASLADSIADRLEPIFRGLSRNRKPVGVPKEGTELEKIRFLGEEALKGETLVRRYLFTPNTIVSLEDLEGDDMLARLDNVEEVAKQLAREMRK